MLRLKYALGLACYVGNLVSATPISSQQGSSLDLDSIFQPSGSVTSPLNLTVSGDTQVQCDGASYGFDLDVVDCEEAKAYVPPNRDQVQWVERNTAWQKEHIPLPYRAMGRKATCYVQTVLVGDATSARASANLVRNAAALIRNRCYAAGKLQGGIATNIGGDNNLAVVMGGYKSPSAIQCSGKMNFPQNCVKVLDSMPATTNQEVFGLRSEPSSTVIVPGEIISDDRKCGLRISAPSTRNPLDTASWYQMWEATVAISSLCTRRSLTGSMAGMGDRGQLFLALTNPPPNELNRTAVKAPIALHSTKFYGDIRNPPHSLLP